MTDPSVIEQLVAFHIDDKQPALGGWLAVIDDGENGFAFVAHGLITVEGLTKGLFIQLAGQTQLTIEVLIPAGICRAAPDERYQQQWQQQPPALPVYVTARLSHP